jgi:hypothetical protein
MARQHARTGDDVPPPCPSWQHRSGAAVPVAPGLRICPACRDVAEEALLTLPSLFEQCAYAIAPPPASERTGDKRQRGVVLCEPVIAMRSEILGVLAGWCALVTSERGVSGPREPGIRTVVGFLAVHLHWLFGHRSAPALVDDLAYLTAAVRAASLPANGARPSEAAE